MWWAKNMYAKVKSTKIICNIVCRHLKKVNPSNIEYISSLALLNNGYRKCLHCFGSTSSKAYKPVFNAIKKANYIYTISTPVGSVCILYDKHYIHAILMENQIQLYQSEIKEIEKESNTNNVCTTCIELLTKYFNKENIDFSSCNTSIQGTDYQKSVLYALCNVSYGRTISYKEFANKFFNVNQVRAIASQIAKNPLSIIVPCHRVIGSDGSLRGYAGGIDNKRILLQLEARG